MHDNTLVSIHISILYSHYPSTNLIRTDQCIYKTYYLWHVIYFLSWSYYFQFFSNISLKVVYSNQTSCIAEIVYKDLKELLGYQHTTYHQGLQRLLF